MTKLEQFENQKYLNIETFRKTGLGVKTPVWFVREPHSEKLLLWTEAASGKAKRMRNNARVMITPSQPDGTPLGEWLSAQAVLDDSDPALAHIKTLMSKKYGLAFAMFGLLGKLRRAKYTSIALLVG